MTSKSSDRVHHGDDDGGLSWDMCKLASRMDNDISTLMECPMSYVALAPGSGCFKES